MVRDLCRSGCRQNYYLTPSPPHHFFSPTHNSFFNTSELFEISARLKLVLVPFSSLVLYIGHLEKSFPESIIKALRWTKLSRFAVSASSNIVLYSRFIWLNGSITLIRAETERYDIVRFPKVTTKSLASGTGS